MRLAKQMKICFTVVSPQPLYNKNTADKPLDKFTKYIIL